MAQLFSLGHFAFMFDDPSSPFDDDRRVPVIPPGILAKTTKAQHEEEFASFDHRELAKMGNKTLAAWQSQFDKDEPMWRLAEHEWQMRSGRFTRRMAILAFIISFLSLVLSGLSYWHPHHEATSTHSTPLKPQP